MGSAITGRLPAPRRQQRRTLLSLLAVQAIVVAAVLAYAIQLPLQPDHGLQQLDALTLHDRVPGVTAVDRRPTLYIATGPLAAPHCRAMAGRLVSHRGKADGLSGDFAVVLLVPGARTSTAPAETAQDDRYTQIREDPGGRTAAALALPDAARHCRPGYAVVDLTGVIRYRTYDPDYGRHSQEQAILLQATALR